MRELAADVGARPPCLGSFFSERACGGREEPGQVLGVNGMRGMGEGFQLSEENQLVIRREQTKD